MRKLVGKLADEIIREKHKCQQFGKVVQSIESPTSELYKRGALSHRTRYSLLGSHLKMFRLAVLVSKTHFLLRSISFNLFLTFDFIGAINILNI